MVSGSSEIQGEFASRLREYKISYKSTIPVSDIYAVHVKILATSLLNLASDNTELLEAFSLAVRQCCFLTNKVEYPSNMLWKFWSFQNKFIR